VCVITQHCASITLSFGRAAAAASKTHPRYVTHSWRRPQWPPAARRQTKQSATRACGAYISPAPSGPDSVTGAERADCSGFSGLRSTFRRRVRGSIAPGRAAAAEWHLRRCQRQHRAASFHHAVPSINVLTSSARNVRLSQSRGNDAGRCRNRRPSCKYDEVERTLFSSLNHHHCYLNSKIQVYS